VDAWSPEAWWAVYLLLGLLVGFFAGMLGIGGGVILVPLLVFIFTAQHFPDDRVVHLALGTSLASIVFTNLTSMRAHHIRGAVLWSVVRAVSPGIIVGTLLGTLVADRLPSRYLAVIFTVFVCYSSVQIWINREPKPSGRLPGRFGMAIAGIVVGAFCSLVGVAGGVITIPLMLRSNVAIRNCIGTAAAIGLPISIAGAVGYIYTGLGKTHLPPMSLGYVYIPALLGLVFGAFVTVPFGARVAHSMPVNLLKRTFAIILFVLAIKMVASLF
jgi:uncharacterized membrane protein YfcA